MNIERDFPAIQTAYTDAAAWLEETLEKMECPLKPTMQISMCFEEAFVNIASYAYTGGTGTAKCIVRREKGQIAVELRDKGIPFDPLAKPTPDVTLKAEDRKIGGLGIFLIKQMMDAVSYERKNDENILIFKKNII